MVNPTDHASHYAPLGVLLLAISNPFARLQAAAPPPGYGNQSKVAVMWRSSAAWHHGLTKTRGTLSLADSGVEFLSAGGFRLRWPFAEIQTFDLYSRRLTLTGYGNRQWRLHGERSFSFELESPVPPSIAAELARRVAKPAVNGVPDPAAPCFATLGARHRTRGGGTNGVLRFRASGIDYVTGSGRGARSWCWTDIQTLALPDAFHFRVGAYREIFGFELKEPMTPQLFDRLWEDVYTRDLSGVNQKGGTHP